MIPRPLFHSKRAPHNSKPLVLINSQFSKLLNFCNPGGLGHCRAKPPGWPWPSARPFFTGVAIASWHGHGLGSVAVLGPGCPTAGGTWGPRAFCPARRARAARVRAAWRALCAPRRPASRWAASVGKLLISVILTCAFVFTFVLIVDWEVSPPNGLRANPRGLHPATPRAPRAHQAKAGNGPPGTSGFHWGDWLPRPHLGVC